MDSQPQYGPEPANRRPDPSRVAAEPTTPRPERHEDVLLTTADVAGMLHLLPQSVLRLVATGRLRAHRIPGTQKFLYWRQDVIDLIEGSVVQPDAVEDATDGETAGSTGGG